MMSIQVLGQCKSAKKIDWLSEAAVYERCYICKPSIDCADEHVVVKDSHITSNKCNWNCSAGSLRNTK